jgi:hypothetical protein
MRTLTLGHLECSAESLHSAQKRVSEFLTRMGFRGAIQFARVTRHACRVVWCVPIDDASQSLAAAFVRHYPAVDNRFAFVETSDKLGLTAYAPTYSRLDAPRTYQIAYLARVPSEAGLSRPAITAQVVTSPAVVRQLSASREAPQVSPKRTLLQRLLKR